MRRDPIEELHKPSFQKLNQMYMEAGKENWAKLDAVIQDTRNDFRKVCKVETEAFHGRATLEEVKAAILEFWNLIRDRFEEALAMEWSQEKEAWVDPKVNCTESVHSQPDIAHNAR